MKSRHFNKDEAEINITPMLDVVFIMLIFFIVTTSFAKETGIDVSRPQHSTPSKPKNNIVVEVKSTGAVWVNKQSTSLSGVRARVETLHAEKPFASAIIVSDHDAKTGDLVNIMDQIKNAGVENISIAADKGSDS